VRQHTYGAKGLVLEPSRLLLVRLLAKTLMNSKLNSQSISGLAHRRHRLLSPTLCSMKEIYAMQRANGDWFALEDHGRFRVPLFHGSHDALMARLRNFGMLLFNPVALDARLLKEMKPAASGSEVDFFIVNNPFASLNRGRVVEDAELALLISSPDERPTVRRNGNGFHVRGLSSFPQSDGAETWEDEGGKYSKSA